MITPSGFIRRRYLTSTPLPNSDEKAKFFTEYTQTNTGLVAKSDFDKLRYLFGTAGNPRLFTIESIEIVELGGKKVFAVSGANANTGTREKNIYVSISDDWKETYEFVFAGAPDKEKFKMQVANFDKALKTVVWRKE